MNEQVHLSKDDYELTISQLRGQLVQTLLQAEALRGSIAALEVKVGEFGED